MVYLKIPIPISICFSLWVCILYKDKWKLQKGKVILFYFQTTTSYSSCILVRQKHILLQKKRMLKVQKFKKVKIINILMHLIYFPSLTQKRKHVQWKYYHHNTHQHIFQQVLLRRGLTIWGSNPWYEFVKCAFVPDLKIKVKKLASQTHDNFFLNIVFIQENSKLFFLFLVCPWARWD